MTMVTEDMHPPGQPCRGSPERDIAGHPGMRVRRESAPINIV